jgi:hypothetical protein
MDIIVCIKQVPDILEVNIDKATNTLIREGVDRVINLQLISAARNWLTPGYSPLWYLSACFLEPVLPLFFAQRYPAYVVECEGSNIAMNEEIVSNICVWREPEHLQAVAKEALAQSGRKGSRWGRFRHRKPDK